MSPKKHSKLRRHQFRRMVGRTLSGLVKYVYEENKEAIDQHALNLMLYGQSKLTVTPEGKFLCTAVQPDGAPNG